MARQAGPNAHGACLPNTGLFAWPSWKRWSASPTGAHRKRKQNTGRTMSEIALAGCTPTPLAAYLKALGILRLVAEQKDPDVRGFWRDETFVLDTALSREDLVAFFLNE